MKSTCRLDRLLHVKENIILQATLEEYEDVRDNMSFAMLQREKVSVGKERHCDLLGILEMNTNFSVLTIAWLAILFRVR